MITSLTSTDICQLFKNINSVVKDNVDFLNRIYDDDIIDDIKNIDSGRGIDKFINTNADGLDSMKLNMSIISTLSAFSIIENIDDNRNISGIDDESIDKLVKCYSVNIMKVSMLSVTCQHRCCYS